MHFTALASGEHFFFFHFSESLSRRLWNRCERRQDIADILWGFICTNARCYTALSERRTTLFWVGKKLACAVGRFLSKFLSFSNFFFFLKSKKFLILFLSLSLGWLYNCVWMRWFAFFLFSLFLTQTHTSARSPPPNWYIYDFHGVFIFPIRKKKKNERSFGLIEILYFPALDDCWATQLDTFAMHGRLMDRLSGYLCFKIAYNLVFCAI